MSESSQGLTRCVERQQDVGLYGRSIGGLQIARLFTTAVSSKTLHFVCLDWFRLVEHERYPYGFSDPNMTFHSDRLPVPPTIHLEPFLSCRLHESTCITTSPVLGFTNEFVVEIMVWTVEQAFRLLQTAKSKGVRKSLVITLSCLHDANQRLYRSFPEICS